MYRVSSSIPRRIALTKSVANNRGAQLTPIVNPYIRISASAPFMLTQKHHSLCANTDQPLARGILRRKLPLELTPVSPLTTMSDLPLLSKLGLLNQEHIKIKDPANVEKIIQGIVDGGFQSLQVVADYDFTLTRVHDGDGVKCHCSWGALDNSPLMPDFYRTETKKLLDKYYPIETCASMTEEEKIPHMVEWYKQVHSLITRCHIHKDDIPKIVEGSSTKLRRGTEQLFGTLAAAEVPLLVFSAGMGDILRQHLSALSLCTDNVKLVSNFFAFDDKGYVDGFEGDMIHMFNKNEHAVHSSPYFSELRSRHNALLLGDSLGDIKMARGLPQPCSILRLGFLNEKMERLPAYLDAYDIVLMDDQTMDVHNALVRLLS